jgi:phosphate transporter
MKFSHSIQFNAVPDWSSHYISYSNLKKLSVPASLGILHPISLTLCRIYQLEKTVHRTSTATDPENSPLISDNDTDPDLIFTRALDVELEKISSFYQLKELEIYGEVSDLLREEETYETERDDEDAIHPRPEGRQRSDSIFRNIASKLRRTSVISQSLDGEIEDSEDEDDELTALHRAKPATLKRSKSAPYEPGPQVEDMRASTEFNKSMRRSSQAFDDYAEQAFSALYSSGISLKKRAISLFVQLCELKSFVQLNKTGFTKVLKKYDKICDRHLKSKYNNEVVYPTYPFRAETMTHIEENIHRMEKLYADVVTAGDMGTAKKELRLHLREHVVWERNTVWREMIGIERKAQAANMGLRRTLLGVDNDPAKARLQGDDDVAGNTKELVTPVGRFTCPTWLFSSTMTTLIVIVAIFFVLLYVPIMKKPEQQNCLAMLVFVSLLWATEV